MIRLIFPIIFFLQILNISVCMKQVELKICARQIENSYHFEDSLKSRHLIDSSKEVVLPLISMLNIHYDTELYFGSTKQPYKLIIDTGSTALWIPNETCNNCKEHNLWKMYSCHKSNTCQIKSTKEEKVKIEYGIGVVEGFGVSDKIYLSDKDLTGFEYDFLLVEKVGDFRLLQMQGIIGLGREEDSEFGEQTILGVMKQHNIIDQKVFSLFLSDSSTCLGNSVLILGGYNMEYAQNEIEYVPLNTLKYWSVDIVSISFVQENQLENGSNKNNRILLTDSDVLNDIKEEQNTTNSNPESNKDGSTQLTSQKHEIRLKTLTAVIDSGTSKLIFPKNDLNALIDVLQMKFSIPCELNKRSPSSEVLTVICEEYDQSKYPNLQFQLGKDSTQASLQLDSVDYIETCTFNLQKRKCILKFLYVPDTPFIILGDILLRKYYLIFDMEKSVIGFSLATVIQPKLFYETSIFLAYLVLVGVIGVLSCAIAICSIRQRSNNLKSSYSVQQSKVNIDPAENSTENDFVNHHAPQLEMTKTDQGDTNRDNSEDQQDVSEEISADEISDIDHYQNNSNSNRNTSSVNDTITAQKN